MSFQVDFEDPPQFYIPHSLQTCKMKNMKYNHLCFGKTGSCTLFTIALSLLKVVIWTHLFSSCVSCTWAAALWTMECLRASLSMSLEYPPPITAATGTPLLTTVFITYRSLLYSPRRGVVVEINSLEMWGGVVLHQSSFSLTLVSQTQPPEFIFPVRVHACVIQHQVWTKSVQ